MTSFTALRVLLVSGELLGGSAVAMMVAWALARRKSASGRHLVWATGFGAALLLPIFVAVLPAPLRIVLSAASLALPPRLAASAPPVLLSANDAKGFPFDPAAIAFACAMLWLAGILAVVFRFAAAAACLALLKRRSRPFACAPEDLPKIAASRRECELRLSDSEMGPATWGAFRPVILLPRTAVFWPRQRLHAVLLHELAHIRRRDSLVQFLALIVCALYWPNPLVWLGARALRREAEKAADDSVILAGLKPSSYASELLQLAAEFRARQPAFSALSLFMAAPSALESRVESLLEPAALRTDVTRVEVVRAAAIGMAAALAVAFVTPSLAQDASRANATLPASPPAAPATPDVRDVPPVPAVPVAPTVPTEPEVPAIRVHVATTAHERKCLRAAMERAEREARTAMARARPEIAKAMAAARVDRQTMLALREARPDIDAAMAQSGYDARPEVRRALDEARNEIARARIDAHIQQRIDAALEHAQMRLEAAEARVERQRASQSGNTDSTDDN